MKVPQLLLQYLLEHHAIRLEGLGTISLDAPPAGFLNEKDGMTIPQGAITFSADMHAKADEDLISHIMQQTGKMRSLASSDMESFTENGKQLLNIAKPFVLEGIGLLQRDAHGVVQFTQDDILLGKEEQTWKRSRPMEAEDALHFEENYRKPAKGAAGRPRVAGIILLAILGIVLLGWVSRYFYMKSARESGEQLELQSPPAVEVKDQPIETKPFPAKDPNAKAPVRTNQPDSALPGSQAVSQPVPPVTSADFNVVVLVATKDRAQRRYDSLVKWGHQVVMSPVDSDHYQLAIPIHAPLSDSSHHRDSLARFFGRKVWIEIK